MPLGLYRLTVKPKLDTSYQFSVLLHVEIAMAWAVKHVELGQNSIKFTISCDGNFVLLKIFIFQRSLFPSRNTYVITVLIGTSLLSYFCRFLSMSFFRFSRICHAFSPFSTIPRRNFRPPPPDKPFDSQKGVLEFLDTQGGGAGAARNGRSWRTAELRLKSYEDLHKLWFILLKERNALLTEKAWCKTNRMHWENGASNLYKVKRSMQRIKGVIGERVRALRAKEARLALREEAAGKTTIEGGEDGMANRERNAEVMGGKDEASVHTEEDAIGPKAI